MKKFLLSILVAGIVISCKKQEKPLGNDSQSFANVSDLSIRESKLYFAKSLAKAVAEDEGLRSFIKKEAIKQFDHDYDVFYQSVKNVIISDGHTFEQKVLAHATSKDSLTNSVKQLPLLTILVPEIGDINAEGWNTGSEIPFVAVEPEQYGSKESIKCFYGKTANFSIPYGSVPGSISLVVKDNERVIVENSKGVYAKAGTKNALMTIEKSTSGSAQFLSDNGMRFSFADNVFNNTSSGSSNTILAKPLAKAVVANPLSGPRPGGSGSNPVIGQSNAITYYSAADSEVKAIIDAKNSGAEWVRDNIYYGINPSTGVDRGPLKRNVKECLTYMRFINPTQVFDVIGKNPGDPQPVDNTYIYQEWTNGSYEFRLTVLINTKNGPSAEVHHTFYCKPSDLFVIGYKYGGHANEGPVPAFREPYVGAANNYKLPVPIPIAGWDLENTSFGWQVYLIKYNSQATQTTSVTTTNTYASNFEFSATFGEKIKIGPKFGGSATTTNTNTYQLQRIYGSSDFGDAILNYSDPVFLSYGPANLPGRTTPVAGQTYYKPYEINLGSVYLAFEPRTVF